MQGPEKVGKLPRFLSDSQVRRLLDPRGSLAVVRRAYSDLARGRCDCPPKQSLWLPGRSGAHWINSMPAVLPGRGVAGVKWVSVVSANKRRGLPLVQGTILLNDARTARPLAVLDAVHITELRTGATVALGVSALGYGRARRFAVIGAGCQARACALALAAALPGPREMTISSRRMGPARKLCRWLARKTGWRLAAAGSTARAARGAEVVVLATSADSPVLRARDLEPGTLVCGLSGFLDLHRDVLRDRRRVVFDSADCGLQRLRDINKLRLDRRRLGPDLCRMLSGGRPTLRRAGMGPIFLPVGLGAADVALAAQAYLRAAKRAG